MEISSYYYSSVAPISFIHELYYRSNRKDKMILGSKFQDSWVILFCSRSWNPIIYSFVIYAVGLLEFLNDQKHRYNHKIELWMANVLIEELTKK